ncbi:hypothetical protein [Sulfurimonas sp.]|uniref:hypothetical protein n=1 Tax=Sulfurimonas sp. TaxID=2022749 RepID=UPI00286E5D3D|nr:hypothetical protein [Sulfurimonas sp.]
MNIFEKMYKSKKEQDLELFFMTDIPKIYDQYLTKDIKNFVKFLRKKDNFLYFIMSMLYRGSQFHNWEFIKYNLVNPYFIGELREQDIYKIDKEMFYDILLKYYKHEAKDSDLYYAFYGQELQVSMFLTDESQSEYLEEIKKLYILPIIDKLYPLSEKLQNNNNNNNFDEDEMIKLFYCNVTKNSFNSAIINFKSNIMPKCLEIFEPSINKDFIYFSEIIIKGIEYLEDHLSKKVFNNQKYTSEGAKKWIPVLEKSEMRFAHPIAMLLKKSLEQYIFGYAIKYTVENNNSSKVILAKNFHFISEFSPIFDFINEVVKLKRSEINYLFFKLLSKNCNMTDKEITFIINIFLLSDDSKIVKKQTYKLLEKNLPFIENGSCDIFQW